MNFLESEVEDAAREWLSGLGYAFALGADSPIPVLTALKSTIVLATSRRLTRVRRLATRV